MRQATCVLLAYSNDFGDHKTHAMTALMVQETQAIALAHALNEVVEYAQDTYGRIKEDAELHAYDLAWGRADWQKFKGNASASADVYKRAIDAIAQFDIVISGRGVKLAGLRGR